MDIITLIRKPEGKTLEFKRDLSSPLGVIRTMIAFANTAGGTIVLGVEDKKKRVCGIKDPLLTEEKLASLINDLITPQILPEIEVVPWRNTYLLTVQIYLSAIKPHFLKKPGLEKGCYIRVGSTNRLADTTMIRELHRIKFEDSFDKQPITELNPEAIDFRVASELFQPVRRLNKKDLESLGLVTACQQKKVPTVGGLILFGKERLEYFPDAWIQVGRFSGNTKTKIVDTREITSYPILAIDDVINFVEKHAMRGIEIKGARHTKVWNLPLTAIREALINAVVHADYAQQGAPIRLAIFDNRIEIENPGLLLPGLTIDEIKQGVSKLRNKVIGQVFFRLGLIERWGSGIKRMIEACQDSGFSEPLFEEIGTHFRVTIYTEQIKKLSLGDVDKTIIEILQNSNGLSTKEIADTIKKSPRATRTRLLSLIEKGLVIEIGTSPNDPNKKYFHKGT